MKKIQSLILYIILTLILCSSCELEESKEQVILEPEALDLNNRVVENAPKFGGRIELFTTQPDTLNPIITQNAYTKEFLSYVYDDLVKIDKEQKPLPSLAKEWSVLEDNKTWIFKLREGVTWHDGMPMTANDVVFTISKILDPAISNIYAKKLENIVTYSAINENVLKIVLREPDSYTPWKMNFPVVPAYYYTNENFINTPRNNKPIGTGAYKIHEYKEKSIVFKSNSKYWDKDKNGKKYNIDEIQINIYESTNLIDDAFKSGKIDMVMLKDGAWERYVGRKDVLYKKYTTNHFEYVAMNLKKSFLRDKVIRQAIGNTIDKVNIVNTVLAGKAIPSDLPILPDTFFNNTDIVYVNSDVEVASKLLDENGWLRDRDGLRYKKIDGKTIYLIIDLMVNKDNKSRIAIAEMIKKQLKEVGIKINVDKVSWEYYIKRIARRDYQMTISGYKLNSIPDISFMYGSEQVNGYNIANYESDVVDDLFAQLKLENDMQKKRTLYHNLKKEIVQDVPYIGLYFNENALIYNRKIRGDLSPTIWNKFNDLSSWYVQN